MVDGRTHARLEEFLGLIFGRAWAHEQRERLQVGQVYEEHFVFLAADVVPPLSRQIVDEPLLWRLL